MTKTKSLLLLILFFGILKSQNSIDIVLDGYKKDKDLQHASYSFCVLDAASGKILKEYNSELALIPASTMKIVTTSAALGILGKRHTFKTGFYFTGKFDSLSGILNGNLLVKGSGDPTINSEYFYSKPEENIISIWIENLQKKGLKKIKGMVFTDATIFDNKIPDQWIWSDIGNYYGACANGLSYADNKYKLILQSFEDGKQTKIINQSYNLSSNKTSGWEITESQFNNKVISGGSEDNAIIYPNGLISGTIPSNKGSYEIEGNMTNPAITLRNELENALEAKKIEVAFNVENIENQDSINNQIFNYSKYKLIYTHQSPTLEKIVYYTNVKSNNHYAESLLNTLGAIKSGKQGTTANGITAVENYWKDRGVDVTGLHMVDGSGLSRANTITTKTQATILSKIYRDSLMYPAFNASLPIAGKNGSMINLCKGTFAEGNMRAKTGYINRARGYCGYVKTKSGKELAFSVLFNNYDCSPKEMKLKIEKLLVALVDL